jgi:putative membrane protein
MDFLAFSLSGFDDFLLYFGLSVAFVAAFLFVYTLITPYREIALIREGNTAAAASLSGTLIGYVLPLASAVTHSVNPWDMALWAVIAAIVQLIVFVVVKMLLPDLTRHITEGKAASGVFLGALSLAAGITNAACMTY